MNTCTQLATSRRCRLLPTQFAHWQFTSARVVRAVTAQQPRAATYSARSRPSRVWQLHATSDFQFDLRQMKVLKAQQGFAILTHKTHVRASTQRLALSSSACLSRCATEGMTRRRCRSCRGCQRCSRSCNRATPCLLARVGGNAGRCYCGTVEPKCRVILFVARDEEIVDVIKSLCVFARVCCSGVEAPALPLGI